MKYVALFFALVLVVVATGCATTQKVDPSRVPLAYYDQTRSFETVKVTGMNKLVMEGEDMTVTVANPLTPLAPPQPKNRGTLDKVLRTIQTLGGVAAGAFVADGMIDAINNDPLVVEPTIITVPE